MVLSIQSYSKVKSKNFVFIVSATRPRHKKGKICQCWLDSMLQSLCLSSPLAGCENSRFFLCLLLRRRLWNSTPPTTAWIVQYHPTRRESSLSSCRLQPLSPRDAVVLVEERCTIYLQAEIRRTIIKLSTVVRQNWFHNKFTTTECPRW